MGEVDAAGQVAEGGTCAVVERLREPVKTLQKLSGLVGPPDQQLSRPFANRGRFRGQIPFVGFQDGMKVRPAESEGADAGPPGLVGVGMEPGTRPGADLERPVGQVGPWVGRLDTDGRREDLVMERQRSIDQPGQARGALGMADHRLDRADRDRTGRRARLAIDARDRVDLDNVADRRAGPVGLDVADGRRPDARLVVGPLQGADLAVGARRGQTLSPAVGGRPQALDHRVDPVAVALGVGQSLEDDDGHPFADHDPIGRGVERSASAARRECLRLAEGEVSERVLDGVGPAQDHDIGRAGLQLSNRQGRRRQRRAAGGVDRVVGAAEVEAVGDPAGGHVQ